MKKIYELKIKENESDLKKEDKNINKLKNSQVFAKFKSKVSQESKKEIPVIPEKCNNFKYKGKIIDYENDILKLYDKECNQDYIEIDYKNFKNKLE